MKIAQLACGLSVLIWGLGCARSPEASAPAASATSPANTNDAAPPAAEAAPIAAPASPAPAPAPQGLSDESRKGAALDQEFSTLEAAEQALNQAKADLDRLALAEPAKELGRSAGSSGSATEKKDRAAQPPKASAAAETAPNLCENACRAFSSLSRAASAVCRLDGKGGSHCAHAKRVLADSQLRVASCSCPTAD